MLRTAPLLVCLILAACAQAPSLKERKMSWQEKMQELSASLYEIIPYVQNQNRFNDPKSFKKIEDLTQKFAQAAHTVEKEKFPPDSDPALKHVSDRFAKDMTVAYQQLKSGDRAYARHLIQQSTTYCVSCHTRTPEGPELRFQKTSSFAGLSTQERIRLFAATRDFEAALNEFDQTLNNPKLMAQDPFGFQQAAYVALAIAVRVKDDPSLALEMVSRIIDSKKAPVNLRLSAQQWRKSVTTWRRESKRQSSFNAKQKLAQAKSLLEKGWNKSGSSVHNRAGLVELLRASKIFHELLREPKANTVYGEALYRAGLSAEFLKEINLWTVHEAYYEACIRHQPGTALARKCFVRFETLQMAPYSELGLTSMPSHVSEHLEELRSLAERNEGNFIEWGLFD